MRKKVRTLARMTPETADTKILSPLREITPEEASEARRVAHRFDGIAIALGVLALLALAWTVRPIINPFIAAFLFYLVLSSLREYRAAKKILNTGLSLFGLWLIITLAGILVPFIVGAVLAYLFNPLVLYLHEKRKISRTWSSLTIVILFSGALFALGWILLPSLAQQTKAFIGQLTVFIKQNANTFNESHVRQMLLHLGLPAGIVDQIILREAGPQLRKMVSIVPGIIVKIIAGLPRILERTLNLIIVPIAMFYFLKDWPKLMPIINGLFPSKDPARRAEIVSDVDRVLYGYIRGQATVAFIIGILGAIAYSILGIPYAGLLGVILAISDLVPIVGMIFSAFIVELVIFLTMELNLAVIL